MKGLLKMREGGREAVDRGSFVRRVSHEIVYEPSLSQRDESCVVTHQQTFTA
jgi:hypothetical protein